MRRTRFKGGLLPLRFKGAQAEKAFLALAKPEMNFCDWHDCLTEIDPAHQMCAFHASMTASLAVAVEHIEWHLATNVPDADQTVLIYDREADEPIWLGYFDGECWRTAGGEQTKVTYWAQLPEGVKGGSQ